MTEDLVSNVKHLQEMIPETTQQITAPASRARTHPFKVDRREASRVGISRPEAALDLSLRVRCLLRPRRVGRYRTLIIPARSAVAEQVAYSLSTL